MNSELNLSQGATGGRLTDFEIDDESLQHAAKIPARKIERFGKVERGRPLSSDIKDLPRPTPDRPPVETIFVTAALFMYINGDEIITIATLGNETCVLESDRFAERMAGEMLTQRGALH